MRRGANCLPSHTGFIADFDTPRMATSGELMMGVNSVPPMPPRLEMVKPAPCMSAPGSLPSRAFALELAERLARRANTSSLSAPLMTGTSRPLRRISREADVEELLEDEVLARLVELAVEHREFAHRAHRGLR